MVVDDELSKFYPFILTQFPNWEALQKQVLQVRKHHFEFILVGLYDLAPDLIWYNVDFPPLLSTVDSTAPRHPMHVRS